MSTLKAEGVKKRKPTINEAFATRLPLLLDTPGLFFVEARSRVQRAKKSLKQLLPELRKHKARIEHANSNLTEEDTADAWTNVILQVGRMETLLGSTIKDFLVADVLLVASAEAYINAIAEHVLPAAEAQQFDKLSPVGKWLILPKMMKLKWKPDLASGNLQEFAALVARRNRVVHPKPLFAESTLAIESLVKQMKLDGQSAEAGVNAVKGLIQEISLAWRGSYGPEWLDPKMSRTRPPCLVAGGVEAGARLGRARKPNADT